MINKTLIKTCRKNKSDLISISIDIKYFSVTNKQGGNYASRSS